MRDFSALYHAELPHRAICVYLYLANRANRSGECWPAIPTIAQELKLSQATVRRAIRDLEREGLLETAQRYRPNGGKSSLLYGLDCKKHPLPPRGKSTPSATGGT